MRNISTCLAALGLVLLQAPALPAAAQDRVPAQSPLQVPLDGVTVIRVMNPGGNVAIKASGTQGSATIAWENNVGAGVPRGGVTTARRTNLLDVVVRYPDLGARDPDSVVPYPDAEAPKRRHRDFVELTLTLPKRVNLDIDAPSTITVDGLEGFIRATSGGGDIAVLNLTGGFDLVTVEGGSIRVEVARLDQGGDSARTERGGIDLRAPACLASLAWVGTRSVE